MQEYHGSLKITNSKTLRKWIANGQYAELISEGYIYAKGCGRFRLEICNCHKCLKYKTKE